LEGVSKSYYESGELAEELTYKKGELIDTQKYQNTE